MSVLRPISVAAGAEALAILPALADALEDRSPALLPVPADDARDRALLTTALRAGEPIDDDVAVVVATSGTTGTPKGAMLTAVALRASAEATHNRLGGPGQWLLALPAEHIAGLQVLVRSLIAGTTPVAIAPNFAPADLVAAIDQMDPGTRRYTAMVAAQLAKVLHHDEATAALARLDAVLIGGGPIPAAVAEPAVAAGINVVRTYGMSETAGGCVYDGFPLDGVRVRLDDSRILLGGPVLAKGYRNPVWPDPFAEPGWFRTDDYGLIDESGALRVLGRVDDAISTGGLTVLPQVVEAAVNTHPAVAESVVFGVPDDRLGQRVVAALVLKPGAEAPSVDDLRTHVARILDRTAAPREIHILTRLPRRGIGKVDRRALAQRFAS
ncbi:o-succinylbenzoate--CoA ligase [Mycolicibacterium thermoresistibile]|uniref:O-succinylbenzoic acid--CoA ligase n=2 Tax=Mycolicibacterium thermoresistibile TaxID=1797 RepID=G7CHD4_MYCT3|nr:o-succinylbenzoate--CoA ligase [Mycolicibacterium thermoresistibile]EHI12244.1 O-succinylbenzoic acid--CoA ligase [Mycolicibacterium thermoresistibile ATCC 19527]MCV7191045.1 o-succinylbenzoate--CoA ligase [Mycolicibacterium thermoresistibile]GAT15610.1 O-succinylbenzoic acid--CoA ligase [Mycolicibacterium thermoresistibile]SNW16839.1 acyl-CoA synthetase (AMP-forming)/AMP-acid ligase II [Mycolicibacterium thermoresistibile]